MARPRKTPAVTGGYYVATDRKVWDADGPKEKGERIELSEASADALLKAGLIERV